MIAKLASVPAAKLAGAALLIALAIAGVQTYRLSEERLAHAETSRTHAETIGRLERRAREAESAARETERRWTAAMERVVNEHQTQIDQARADADAAASAGERLRQRVAELTAGCRRAAGGSAVAGSGQAADATARVLADVQRRLDAAADRVARHADEARAAGLACERAYGALSASR